MGKTPIPRTEPSRYLSGRKRNYLLLSASDTEGYEGRAVTFMEGEDAYGWIKEKYNVGILRPNPEGEGAYVITASGTAF